MLQFEFKCIYIDPQITGLAHFLSDTMSSTKKIVVLPGTNFFDHVDMNIFVGQKNSNHNIVQTAYFTLFTQND